MTLRDMIAQLRNRSTETSSPDPTHADMSVTSEPSPVPTAPVTGGAGDEPGERVHMFGTQHRVRRDAADVIAGRLGPSGLARRIGDDVGGLGSRPNTARDAMVRRAGFGEVIFDDD